VVVFSATEPKELIDHYGDSQQHQQRHDDCGTHPLIILLGWRADSRTRRERCIKTRAQSAAATG
jgi:hypothetical protein